MCNPNLFNEGLDNICVDLLGFCARSIEGREIGKAWTSGRAGLDRFRDLGFAIGY